MNVITAPFRWLGAKMRAIRELTSGEDLQDAQEHRGDYHEFRSNPGGPVAGGM